jgi:hypothetical protein
MHAARTRSPHPTRNALRCYKDRNEKDLVLCHNIPYERFESFSSRLHDRYGHMTCLACFDIAHDARFACMRAFDDFAFRAVLQFSIGMGFHQEPPESPALYSEIPAAKLAAAAHRRLVIKPFGKQAGSHSQSHLTQSRRTGHISGGWVTEKR